MVSELERLVATVTAEKKAGPLMIALHDTQLVLFLAGLVSGEGVSEEQAVAYAISLVAETKVQLESGALGRALELAKARASAGVGSLHVPNR